MINIEVPDSELNEWLEELKPYQKNTISQLFANTSPEEAAEIWITSTGPENTIPFGGVRDTKPFFDNFKAEFKKFICDNDSYSEEKKALAAENPITKAILISAISGAIGASIGYTATLLAPAVTILLFTVGKMGKNAYCNNG